MKSVMLDIETLSSRKDAMVISIGLAAFDDTKVIQTAGWALDLGKLLPGHIDPKTVKWWAEQSAPAREYSFTGKVDPLQAAMDITAFFKLYGGDELWANDPTFDCVILRNWWDEMNLRGPRVGSFPSHYREERSMRTIKAEAGRMGHDLSAAWQNGHVAHNPVDDAAVQARAVMLARQMMTSGMKL